MIRNPVDMRLQAGGQVTGAERLDGDEMTGGDKAQHKGVVPALLFISCHMSLGLSDACRQLLEGCELALTAPAWNSASLGALGDRNPSQLPTSNRKKNTAVKKSNECNSPPAKQVSCPPC